jgi:SAM-dependent methyltransferase
MGVSMVLARRATDSTADLRRRVPNDVRAVTRAKIAAKRMIPPRLWLQLQLYSYRHGKRTYWYQPAETSKSRARREREGFFERYCCGSGLDVGYGGDPVVPGVRGWDLTDGDAHHLKGVEDASFDFVYASHLLEHMHSPELALRNWWRVVRFGGFLIVAVPERGLYERRSRLPSRLNPDHKTFFLLDRDDPPDTLGLLPLIKRTLDEFAVCEAKVCDGGYALRGDDAQPAGEYQIEVVLRKERRA